MLRRASGELIQATCTRPVDEQTARAIAERTGGNPFFIRETTRLLDSEGKGHWRQPSRYRPQSVRRRWARAATGGGYAL
jgi:predicted ATPase